MQASKLTCKQEQAQIYIKDVLHVVYKPSSMTTTKLGLNEIFTLYQKAYNKETNAITYSCTCSFPQEKMGTPRKS